MTDTIKSSSNDCIKIHRIKSKKSSSLQNFILRHLPILTWLPNYDRQKAFGDAVSGITVGLTMVPQSMAYAMLANLAPQVGLYSGLMGGIFYLFLGTVNQVSIGPTSLMALLTYEYTKNLPPIYIPLLTFICGLVEMAMGLLKLGFLVNLISAPVISGFTTATSFIIVLSQLKGILGVRFKGDTVTDIIEKLIEHFHERRNGDIYLGLASIVFLLIIRQLQFIVPAKGVLKQILWIFSISRNTLIVLITMFITLFYEINGISVPFLTTNTVEPGYPTFQLPPFGYTSGNTTVTLTEMLYEIRSAIIVIPLVSILANVSIAKAYANGGTINATQEMLALATCNIFGSFIRSMPVCGAFTRSAVSQASGVQTPMSGIYSTVLMNLAILYLTPHFHLIPRAVLSAVLIAAVIFLVDYQIVKPLWKTNRIELFVASVTLLTSLFFTVEIGLLVGVCANILHLALLWSRPKLIIEISKVLTTEFVLVTPNSGLYFPSTDYLYKEIMRIRKHEVYEKKPIVLNCVHFKGLDYTAARGLCLISEKIRATGHMFILLNVSDKMKYIIRKTGCNDLVYCNSIESVPVVINDDCSKKVPLFKPSDKDVKIALAELTPLLQNQSTETTDENNGTGNTKSVTNIV
ncbi:sodium-independent sulfate anion transporter-like isoform X2 [Daktulosphaira vitifoliae]|uniref:sodium-independent sulfate anion transporter-like isoform X2 n=1 Tax=Daktulosphaira vitifoliae TaxID=58002 RepID=UPI0021AA1945|nr:sodium-independent sulfate anion transporter-like isoform X2 [Daktulosphaira vitifoliae]